MDEKKKKRDPAFAKREAIGEVLTQQWRWRRYDPHDDADNEDSFVAKLDPRWLDLAVEQKHLELVQALARPGHAAANKLLARRSTSGSRSRKTCGECGHRSCKRWSASSIRRRPMPPLRSSRSTPRANQGYGLYWIGQLIPDLPKDALPKLEALLPTLPEKVIDQLLGLRHPAQKPP